jgi:ATP-binding cassette subfamily F protein 1
MEEKVEEKLSRKERKKNEANQRHQELLENLAAAAENVNRPGDSPFSVTLEQATVPEGSRNISLNKVSVSVNGKTLFKDTTVKLSAGSRYGLMGPNGRGKSTLLRLLSTRELPIQSNLDILLVEQEKSSTRVSCPLWRQSFRATACSPST